MDSLCDLCPNTNRNHADIYCTDCKKYVCGTCITIHKKIPDVKFHKFIVSDSVAEYKKLEQNNKNTQTYIAKQKDTKILDVNQPKRVVKQPKFQIFHL